jgi:hypothetical protein
MLVGFSRDPSDQEANQPPKFPQTHPDGIDIMRLAAATKLQSICMSAFPVC